MSGGLFDIVIPTIGRSGLRRLLEGLAASDGPLPGSVFLVDDRPDPRRPLSLPALPPAWQDRIILLRGSSAGPAAARNTGWRASSAAWVAFLDDDVVPAPGWLEGLHMDLSQLGAEIGGSQGRIEVPLPAGRRPTDWERNVAGLEVGVWITADMAYRRQALTDVDGFDERFRRPYREDADLALRVREAGYRLVRGARLVRHPPGPQGFWTSVKLQAGNFDDALMAMIHGRRWRAEARAGRGRFALHLVTSIALAAGLFGRGTLRQGSLAMWAAFTARFAWKRIAPGPRTAAEVMKMAVTSAVIPPVAVLHRSRGELLVLSGRAGVRGVGAGRRGILEPAPRASRSPLPSRIGAVLFDRDGTLVEDVPYNGDPEKVEFRPGAAEAVRRLREAGVATGVVSNQSGVARGYLTTSQVGAVNERIEKNLGHLGTWVICEHGPEEGCSCRKPEPGMVLEAARRLGVDPAECVVIGDIGADVEAARKAGAASILVPGPITLPEEIAAAPAVARSLLHAVGWVLSRAGENGGGR